MMINAMLEHTSMLMNVGCFYCLCENKITQNKIHKAMRERQGVVQATRPGLKEGLAECRTGVQPRT